MKNLLMLTVLSVSANACFESAQELGSGFINQYSAVATKATTLSIKLMQHVTNNELAQKTTGVV